jgi:hypothetical protein
LSWLLGSLSGDEWSFLAIVDGDPSSSLIPKVN